VIGWPARHSLSPVIHNAALGACGLDWVYVAFEVPEGAAGLAVGGMRSLGIEGLSVTMPHKAAVIGALDVLTPDAEALGAVNCISRDGPGLLGDNTDGIGFLDALRIDEGVDPAGMRCVVVGAGGAGRAVARALGGAGAAEVVVVNRSPEPAVRAAELAGPAGRVGTAEAVDAADLVVNATPLGMGVVVTTSGDGEPLPVDPDRLGAASSWSTSCTTPPPPRCWRRRGSKARRPPTAWACSSTRPPTPSDAGPARTPRSRP
jgi:shikimate dehydrogenase